MKADTEIRWAELAPYAGRWVALVRGRVAGVGWTSDEARQAAKRSRSKEESRVIFVPATEEPSEDVCLPDWPWQAVRRLVEDRGGRIWVVGGAVRDIIFGHRVHDWDFAVERDGLALARATADALGGDYFPLDAERDTGRAILTTVDGNRLELDFAALRGASLEADLVTRDFTINAMALNERDGLVDPTGGRADLDAHLIRATGDQVFRDDPLRLLRAVRIAAELGFQIEAQTAACIRRDAALVTVPASERVRDEFVRLINVRGTAGHLQRLDEFGLLSRVMPELERIKGVTQSQPHRFDVWRHTLETLDVLEGVIAAVTGGEIGIPVLAEVPAVAWDDLAQTLDHFNVNLAAHLAVEVSDDRDRTMLLKLGALLHDIGKVETRSRDEDGRIHFYSHEPTGARLAAARLRQLRFSREEVERVSVTIGGHLRPSHLARTDKITRRAVYRYYRALGDAGVEVALLSLADHLATWGPGLQKQRWAKRLEVAKTLLTHYFERHDETIAPPPLVTGHELMAELGLSKGPEVGRLLEALREAQAAGEVKSRDEALALALRI